eukprot:TRINITY_DN116_c3_g1_i1.p1 TRINITY_DN116_c3_g1~~TRINITY_DN116_c3_g1_i1.p1  ORF type:complete len:228 (+),score=65.35 TRINITY_DN116_c3_g1_i1:192-875(+)
MTSELVTLLRTRRMLVQRWIDALTKEIETQEKEIKDLQKVADAAETACRKNPDDDNEEKQKRANRDLQDANTEMGKLKDEKKDYSEMLDAAVRGGQLEADLETFMDGLKGIEVVAPDVDTERRVGREGFDRKLLKIAVQQLEEKVRYKFLLTHEEKKAIRSDTFGVEEVMGRRLLAVVTALLNTAKGDLSNLDGADGVQKCALTRSAWDDFCKKKLHRISTVMSKRG